MGRVIYSAAGWAIFWGKGGSHSFFHLCGVRSQVTFELFFKEMVVIFQSLKKLKKVNNEKPAEKVSFRF